MTQPKKRIVYFDLLKGTAIFLVVMGHVLTMCIRGVDAAFLFKFIGQVHMPVFFFISGYMTYKATETGGWTRPNLGKRFLQLIVPFVVMSALWVWYFPHSHLESPLHDNLPDLYQSYWKDGYWFTLCLMQMCIVYWPLSVVMSRIKRLCTQLAIIVVFYAGLVALSINFANEEANIDPAGVGLLARFFPVFMMGVLAHHYRESFYRLWHCELYRFVALVLGAVTFYAVVYPWDMPWLPAWAEFVTIPLFHLCLMVVALSLIEPWSNREYGDSCCPSIVARFFNYIGNESLGLYLCHYFFLFPLTMLRQPVIDMGLATLPLVVISAIVALCIVGITLLAMRLIKCSNILSFLMLGKPLKKKLPPQE